MLKRGLVALVLIGSVGIFAPHVARADVVVPTGYDIEHQTFYCSNGTPTCSGPTTARYLIYMQAQAVSYSGVHSGAPDGIDLVCGRHYLDPITHHFHAISERVNPGIAKVGGVETGYGPGWIKGNASVAQDATESNTHAVSTMNIVAFDKTSGDYARAWGTSVTDNVTDTQVSGGFVIYLHGPIYDDDFTAHTTTVVGYGDMGCHTTYITPIYGPGPGPFFEGVYGQTDGGSEPNGA